jgi:hypothetical protein
MATGRIPTTANSPLTVKGDLFGYSTTQARVPVGNDGETLVADSSTATGLAWAAPSTGAESLGFTAGKNKIINGDFGVNQRGFASTTGPDYCYDRWTMGLTAGGGTVTFSAQTFTPGTAPVAGYEGKNFFRCVTSGQVNTNARAAFRQNIESVRTFAGQTVTVSFWAKAGSGTPNLNAELVQVFGSGGSPSAEVSTAGTKQAITTSWARYYWTIVVPSISGKTIGTAGGDFLRLNIWASAGSNFDTTSGTLGIQNNTFDIWGVQVEAGSTATAFQTATGTIQGELAACQRYFQTLGNWSGTGWTESTTVANLVFSFPVKMRTAPAFTVASTLTNCLAIFGVNYFTPTSWSLQNAKDDSCWINTNTFTGLTALRFCSSAITIGSVSAEL